MNTTSIVTTCFLAVFFAIMIFVGIKCRKSAISVDGFVLGGRNVGPWLTAFAFGTSYFSAVIFVGYAGQFGWNFGVASTWIGLGNAFIGSLLAWVILGKRTRIMTHNIGSKTMPDFFAKRFDSNALKIMASVIVFVFLVPYTASLYNGLSSLFNITFSIPYWVCIAVMAVLTGIYVIFGGYIATAINDFIQGIIMLFGIIVVVVAVIMSKGGLSEALDELSQIESSYAPTQGQTGVFASIFGAQPIYLIFVVLLTSLGTWGLPQMVGKFYSIKDENAIKKGTVISTVFAIIVAGGCYFLGSFGRLFVDADKMDMPADGFDSIIPSMLKNLSPFIIATVIVLVLSASMSTLSSLVLTSSSTLTLDVICPMFKNKADEKKKVIIIRLFISFFIILSAVLAFLKDEFKFTMIAQMMGVSWGALAGAFLAPFLYGLYWKKTTKISVGVCFAYGVIVELFQLIISLGYLDVSGNAVLGFVFKNSLYSGVFAMVGGLIIVPIVSLFTQKSIKNETDEIFNNL